MVLIPLIVGVLSHYEKRNIHIFITPTHKADTWVKPFKVDSKGKYLDAVGNIGVTFPHIFRMSSEFLKATLFRANFSPPSMGR